MVRPGETGGVGVGVPVLVAHARRVFDTEVGRWRTGPRGPPPCSPGWGGRAGPHPPASRARTCPSRRAPGSRPGAANPVCRAVGGLCALRASHGRVAAGRALFSVNPVFRARPARCELGGKAWRPGRAQRAAVRLVPANSVGVCPRVPSK